MKNTIFKKVNPENCCINCSDVKVLTQNINYDEDVEMLDVKIVDRKTRKTIFEAESITVEAPISDYEWDDLEEFYDEYGEDEVDEAWDNVINGWESRDGEYESELEQMLYEKYKEHLGYLFDDWFEQEYEYYEYEGCGVIADIFKSILDAEGYDEDVVYTVSANGSVNIYQFEDTYNEKTYEDMYLLKNVDSRTERKVYTTQIK